MTRKGYPPQPSVEHLTTLFRRIELGDIVVPAFQRAFVWGAGEMLDLLESVNAGYPIGSLLLWSADEEILKISRSDAIPFPQPNIEMPVHYILDGLQRLSTLYGAFHYEQGRHDPAFDIHFDLTAQRFVRGEDTGDLHATLVPMSSLFKPKRMIEIQRNLIERGLFEDELDRLTALQGRFQEYMVPIVTLGQRDIEEVVSIFERVNSTGTRLSRVDFMRAVTWSTAFDLNHAIDQVRSELETSGFELDDDTIVKGLAQQFGLDPIPDSLIKLRDQQPAQLHAAIPHLIENLKSVFNFLREDVGVFSEQFVPYEGQILALVKVFDQFGALAPEVRTRLRAWFLRISFEEALQGRPDHYVATMIEGLIARIPSEALSPNSFGLDEGKFVRRRMLKGKALTSAVYVMLAREEPIDIFTGKQIEPYEMTAGYDSGRIVPIFETNEIAAITGSRISSKVPANIVISNAPFAHGNLGYLKNLIMELAGSEGGRDILKTHLIDQTVIDGFKEHGPEGFIERRAQLMLKRARMLVGAI